MSNSLPPHAFRTLSIPTTKTRQRSSVPQSPWRSTKRQVELVSVASLILLIVTSTASAYNISSITISPGDPITSSDSVSVDVGLYTPTSSAVFLPPDHCGNLRHDDLDRTFRHDDLRTDESDSNL